MSNKNASKPSYALPPTLINITQRFRLTADSKQWILQQKKRAWINIGYHSSIRDALRQLIQMELRSAPDLETLGDLLKKVDQLDVWLTEQLGNV